MEEKFTDSERAVMLKMMEDVYGQFASKAAAGRKMERDKLETLAQGRLWSGRQAEENGLVDEVGTLRDAIKAAKVAGGMKEDEKAELLILPKPKSVFESLLDPSASDASMSVQAQKTLQAFSPAAGGHLADIALWQQLLKERAVLMLPYRVQIK
jgi:protease-4